MLLLLFVLGVYLELLLEHVVVVVVTELLFSLFGVVADVFLGSVLGLDDFNRLLLYKIIDFFFP